MELTRKWAVGSIPVPKAGVTEARLTVFKRSAVNIVMDRTKLPRNEMEAVVSEVGDPQ